MELQELINKAWELKKHGQRTEALELYSKAFDTLTTEASGHARTQENTFIDKEENGEKIRQILPKHFDEAKKYLKQDKVAATISNNMAVIFAELGDTDSAKKLFEQSIDLTPDGMDYPDPRIGLQELNK